MEVLAVVGVAVTEGGHRVCLCVVGLRSGIIGSKVVDAGLAAGETAAAGCASVAVAAAVAVGAAVALAAVAVVVVMVIDCALVVFCRLALRLLVGC